MGPIYSSPTELGPEIKEIQNIATGETSEALLSLFELHHLHHFHHLFHPFLSISSTSIHVHLPSSIFIHFYSCSSISSIYPLLSIFIHFNRPSSIWPCVSTFIYLSPQSSILIYFINSYPFSSILIHRHPFASTFTFTFFLHKSPVLLLRNLQLNLKVWPTNLQTNIKMLKCASLLPQKYFSSSFSASLSKTSSFLTASSSSTSFSSRCWRASSPSQRSSPCWSSPSPPQPC